MSGTLHVTGAGTPLARPAAELTLRTKKIAKALKKGLLVGDQRHREDRRCRVAAKLGKTTVGQADGLASLRASSRDMLKLSKAGKSMLRQEEARRAITLSAATIPFGSPATAKGKLS